MKKPELLGIVNLAAVCFFLLLVFVPTAYVGSYALSNWGTISSFVLESPERLALIKASILFSLKAAALVTLLDVVIAVPLAWLMVRYRFSGREWLDTLVDVPLVIPTAALGFSAAIFWSIVPGMPPGLIVGLVLLAFSLPYMVRTLVAVIDQIDITYELAARSLGASRLTVFRTISLPMFKEGLLTGAIISFARCISETGAVMTALSFLNASGIFTATVLIANWKAQPGPEYVAASAFVALLLIVIGLALTLLATLAARRLGVPVVAVFPGIEGRLSRGAPVLVKNAAPVLLFLLLSLIPSTFIVTRLAGGGASFPDIPVFMSYFLSSLAVALAVTALDVAFGIPMALLIARGRGLFVDVLETLVTVPILVPTAAVGFSLGLFWSRPFLPAIPPIVLVIFAHASITYSYIVKTCTAAIRGVDADMESAARTLGANRLDVLRTITLPLVKPALVAGAIMAFTRSLDETGATLAVSPKAMTVPVYVVNLVKAGAFPEAAGASIILIAVSYLLLVALRKAVKK